jgi:hypothetical protein
VQRFSSPCFPLFFVTHSLLILFLHQTRLSERDNEYVSFDYNLDLGLFPQSVGGWVWDLAD